MFHQAVLGIKKSKLNLNIFFLSGLQVSYNISLPEGERVTSVFVGNKKSDIPLDPEVYYHVVVPAYLADGGDGFSVKKCFCICIY